MSSHSGNANIFVQFGEFCFDTRSGELERNGRPVKLQPQPARLLALLASRAGDLVTREEIQSELWSGETFVDYEHGINYCIQQIRSALSDDKENPRFVQTVPRQGYRFVANVEARQPSPRHSVDAPRFSSGAWLWAAVSAVALAVALLSLWRSPRATRDVIRVVESPGEFMSVQVRDGELSSREHLFDVHIPNWGANLSSFYGVADGERFLVLDVVEAPPTPLTIVVNWMDELPR